MNEVLATLRARAVKVEPPEGETEIVPFLDRVRTADQLTSFDGDDADSYVVPPLIARSSSALLIGSAKAGKSTLIRHLLGVANNGGWFLGQYVEPFRCLVISEEPERLWSERDELFDFGPKVVFLCKAFRFGKASAAEWQALTEELQEARDRYDLIIVDTGNNQMPVKEENEASDWLPALNTLGSVMAEDGPSLLVSVHTRKSGESDGDPLSAIRGSSALAGWCDTALILKRQRGDAHIRRRTLTVISRWSGAPDQLVLELSEDERTYRCIGSPGEAASLDVVEIIVQILGDTDEPLTHKQIQEAWPEGDGKPCKSRIGATLKAEAERGRLWTRVGAGGKKDPYRYALVEGVVMDPSTHPHSGGEIVDEPHTESETPIPPPEVDSSTSPCGRIPSPGFRSSTIPFRKGTLVDESDSVALITSSNGTSRTGDAALDRIVAIADAAFAPEDGVEVISIEDDLP